MIESYLPLFIWFVLFAGLFLVFWRPYVSFLLVVCIIISLPTAELAQMRTVFGPYFNVLDASLLVAFVTMVTEKRIFKLVVPNGVFFMSAVLLIGTLISLFNFGFTYETIRAFRWALSFILFFLISSNMVTNELRARAIIVVLFAGTIVGSLRSVFFIVSNVGVYMLFLRDSIIRTVRFMSIEPSFLLFMIIWPLPKKLWHKAAYIGAGILFCISIGFSQTRSVWFAMILSLPFVIAIYSKRMSVFLKRLNNLFVLGLCGALAIISCDLLFGINLIDLTVNRVVEGINSVRSGGEFGTASTRMLAMKYELQAWLDSMIVFGKGLSYFQKDIGKGIAYNHLGYLTYLSQLGLLGFVVYGLYIPISVIQNSIKTYYYTKEAGIKLFAVLSGCAMVYYSICFLMSGSFLSHACIPGILAGGIWALSRRIDAERKIYAKEMASNRQSESQTERKAFGNLGIK